MVKITNFSFETTPIDPCPQKPTLLAKCEKMSKEARRVHFLVLSAKRIGNRDKKCGEKMRASVVLYNLKIIFVCS